MNTHPLQPVEPRPANRARTVVVDDSPFMLKIPESKVLRDKYVYKKSRLTMNTTFSTSTNDRYSARNMAKPVNFYCSAPTAQSVCLVGDFNGWNSLANPMRRQADGSWFARVELTHGHHRYCFLVDGEPALDPRGNGITRNERNERVSLIAVS